MLSVGLALFCLRYIIPEELWSDRAAKISFWSLNLGLAWMVFATLFPLGVLQLYHSVAHGLRCTHSGIRRKSNQFDDRVAATSWRHSFHSRWHPTGSVPLLAGSSSYEGTEYCGGAQNHPIHGTDQHDKRKLAMHGIDVEVLLASGYAIFWHRSRQPLNLPHVIRISGGERFPSSGSRIIRNWTFGNVPTVNTFIALRHWNRVPCAIGRNHIIAIAAQLRGAALILTRAGL
jgi:hypothetical protein